MMLKYKARKHSKKNYDRPMGKVANFLEYGTTREIRDSDSRLPPE